MGRAARRKRANRERFRNPEAVVWAGDASVAAAARATRDEREIVDCRISPDWRDTQMATVVIARQASLGKRDAAFFCVDTGCLGVKDCFRRRLSAREYGRYLARFADSGSAAPEPCDPSVAAAVVYGAVAYARSLGFEPADDFERASEVLPELDPADALLPDELGRDGKPHYVAGPGDDVPSVLAQLQERLGSSGFDVDMPAGASLETGGADDEFRGMVPLGTLLPEVAEAETRTVFVVEEQDGVPADSYGFVELYCRASGCDCRRVMLSVCAASSEQVVATISYGFDRDADDAGPFLEPFGAQSAIAKPLLRLAEAVLLRDREYVARLERHYRQFKQEGARIGRQEMPADVYAPCPCGSGKKVKFCCRERLRRSA